MMYIHVSHPDRALRVKAVASDVVYPTDVGNRRDH
jgi:hypothetical protein